MGIGRNNEGWTNEFKDDIWDRTGISKSLNMLELSLQASLWDSPVSSLMSARNLVIIHCPNNVTHKLKYV